MTNKRINSEFIDELPENIYEITEYNVMFEIRLFDRYWWDADDNRLIMKTMRGNKYKVVKPLYKNDGTRFVHMYDIKGRQTFVNYDWLLYSHSLCYYLNHMILNLNLN